MTHPLKGRALPLNGPASDVVPVTPNDTTELARAASALYIETGGALVIETLDGATRTITVADFATLPVVTTKVLSTGTTATGIHALVTT